MSKKNGKPMPGKARPTVGAAGEAFSGRKPRILAAQIDLRQYLPPERAVELTMHATRKDLTLAEVYQCARVIKRALAQAARQRQLQGVHQPDGGRTRDVLETFFGMSGRSVEKVIAVGDAAHNAPEQFGDLYAKMERGGKIDPIHSEWLRRRDQLRIPTLVPVEGRFRTLIIDPPWAYDQSIAGRARPQYATMTVEQLMALRVPMWIDENGHVYLWVTNGFMEAGHQLMRHWGVPVVTILTWVKTNGFGLGTTFRNSTEHVLFGVRGQLPIRRHDLATHFMAPRGEHSAKPDAFYDLVRQASYPPFGEAFQRQPRDGFVNLFQARARV